MKNLTQSIIAVILFLMLPQLIAEEPAARKGASEAAPLLKKEEVNFPEGVIALIAGEPLKLSEVKDKSYERFGLQVIYPLINSKVIRAEAAKKNITVSQDEITAKYIDAVSNFASQSRSQDAGTDFKNYLRQQMGLTIDAFKHSIETQLLLQKLVENDKEFNKRPDVANMLNVSKEDVEYMFDEIYGARYTVQLIVASKDDLEKVKNELKAGADFGEVSAKYSIDAGLKATKGNLIPMSASLMKKSMGNDNAALILKLKAGEHMEPFFWSSNWQIVKLVSISPATKEKMDDKAEGEIRKQVQDGKLQSAMELYRKELIDRYDIKYNEALFPEIYKD